jgi:hypothetical protein
MRMDTAWNNGGVAAHERIKKMLWK